MGFGFEALEGLAAGEAFREESGLCGGLGDLFEGAGCGAFDEELAARKAAEAEAGEEWGKVDLAGAGVDEDVFGWEEIFDAHTDDEAVDIEDILEGVELSV